MPRRKQPTITHMIDVALTLLELDLHDDLSSSSICTACGVSRATAYRYLAAYAGCCGRTERKRRRKLAAVVSENGISVPRRFEKVVDKGRLP